MRWELRLGAIVLVLGLAACGAATKGSPPPPTPTPTPTPPPVTAKVRIAAHNGGQTAIDDVVLDFNGKHGPILQFGNVAPGATTRVQGADGADGCWNVRATVDGTSAGFIPTDLCATPWGGPLVPGSYTLELKATGTRLAAQIDRSSSG